MTVARLTLLKWYNDLQIGVMPPEVRLRALNQGMVASAINAIPGGMAKAETDANANVARKTCCLLSRALINPLLLMCDYSS
jgi:hypothetical protein